MGFREGVGESRKHGVSFEEASSIFGDPLSITIPDPYHSRGEYRFLDVGLSHAGRILVVAYAERRRRIRIINARVAGPHERRTYEEPED